MIRIKRIYDLTASENGKRILLVDRIRLRGLSKEQAKVDGWLKELEVPI